VSTDGSTANHIRCERVPPLHQPDLDERWLLAYIRECPEVFGLGDLVLDEARTRSAPGRLELVLHDPDANRQYDVALQAGATDDRQFLRAVELWAAERKRTPRRCHFALLIAEHVGSRFLGIAGLLKPSVPLVVLRMETLRAGDTTSLRFIKLIVGPCP
jgi:hypothetical protein